MDKIVEYVPVALQVLGGLIAVLVAVSPLTKSDLDNKALKFLRALVAFGGKLVGHKDAA